MPSRRDFVLFTASSAALLSIGVPALAHDGSGKVLQATAVTQVFGNGIRLSAVAVEFDLPIQGTDLPLSSFQVAGRSVTAVYTSSSADPADRAAVGRFVIIALSPDDLGAALANRSAARPPERANPQASTADGPPRGASETSYKLALAAVMQATPVTASDGTVIAADQMAIATTDVKNLIVDDFKQLEFHDPKTGDKLKYNLFTPANYDAAKSYPLVLFMHDAGATSSVTQTTLWQGLGAIAWASPTDQAQRPCFVLAPQYEDLIANDKSQTTSMLDTTIDLLQTLTRQYSIDSKRLYATGQSGGCMMSIAMNIAYPDLFAASFLVAGQWDPALVKPLARKKLWILVSQDDNKAFPGQNAITAALEKEGAKISRATWDGTWTQKQFRLAFDKMAAENSPINYVAFRSGTVIPAGESTAGAAGHMNTWRIAYTIEPIREWIFRQTA